MLKASLRVQTSAGWMHVNVQHPRSLARQVNRGPSRGRMASVRGGWRVRLSRLGGLEMW
jgi:hypothetical protein